MSVFTSEQVAPCSMSALGRAPCSVGPWPLPQQQANNGAEDCFGTLMSAGCSIAPPGGVSSCAYDSVTGSFTWSLPREGSGFISGAVGVQPQEASMCSSINNGVHTSDTSQSVLHTASYNSTRLTTAPQQYAAVMGSQCLQVQPAVPAAILPARAVHGLSDKPTVFISQCPQHMQPTSSVTFLSPGIISGRPNSTVNHSVNQDTSLVHQLILQQNGQTTVYGSPMGTTPVKGLTTANTQHATMFLSSIAPSAVLPSVGTPLTAVSAPFSEQLQLQLLRQENALLQQRLAQQQQQALQQQQRMEQKLQSLVQCGVQHGPTPAPSTGLASSMHRQLSLAEYTDQPVFAERTHIPRVVVADQAVVCDQRLSAFANNQCSNERLLCFENVTGAFAHNNKAVAASSSAGDAVQLGTMAVAQQQAPAENITGPLLELTRSQSDMSAAVGSGQVVALKRSESEAAARASLFNCATAGSAGTGVYLRMGSAAVQPDKDLNKHSIPKPTSSFARAAQRGLSSAASQGTSINLESQGTGCSSDGWFTSEEVCAANLKRLSLSTLSSRQNSADVSEVINGFVDRCKASAPVAVPAGSFADVMEKLCLTDLEAKPSGSLQRCAPKWATDGWDPKAQVVALGTSASKGTGAFILGARGLTGTGAFMPPAVKQAIAAAAKNSSCATPDSSNAQNL